MALHRRLGLAHETQQAQENCVGRSLPFDFAVTERLPRDSSKGSRSAGTAVVEGSPDSETQPTIAQSLNRDRQQIIKINSLQYVT